MKRTKNTKSENYLERVPIKKPTLNWSVDSNGTVVLEKENRGAFNRVAQRLLKKPKISYIHLDEMGSFIWPLVDGKTDITGIGMAVGEHFGDAAEPLYERLAQYFQMLEQYGFVTFA